VDKAQSRQWQDPVFSHAGTASYPWYQMIWHGIQRSCQWENETTRLIADRRHSLFGHTCRLPENTPASQALQLSIEAHTGTLPAADWNLPPSRPRRNWLHQVEEDIGLSVGAARIAGQDCSTWRTLRPSAGQVQQWVSQWVKLNIKFATRLVLYFPPPLHNLQRVATLPCEKHNIKRAKLWLWYPTHHRFALLLTKLAK